MYVSVLLSNCKQSITSLSLLVGTIVVPNKCFHFKKYFETYDPRHVISNNVAFWHEYSEPLYLRTTFSGPIFFDKTAGANFINEFTTCFCLKNIVRSSYVKNWVSSNY